MHGDTTEHLFNACKTLNKCQREMVIDADTPREAKRIGRQVDLRPRWDDIRVGVMADLTQIKFSRSVLAEQLLDTGDALLFEGNTWGDHFWGVDINTGVGQNWLGRLLMITRSRLLAGHPSSMPPEPAALDSGSAVNAPVMRWQ